MFDGPILHEGPEQCVVFMDPAHFIPEVGHFNSYFCWCHPYIVDLPHDDGTVSKELGHINITYDFGGRV